MNSKTVQKLLAALCSMTICCALVGSVTAGPRAKDSPSTQPKDDQDEIRHALKKVGEELHALMIRVLESSEQIASGSGQIADASQSLSQGATEQEALENIRSAITEYLDAVSELTRGKNVREVEVAS